MYTRAGIHSYVYISSPISSHRIFRQEVVVVVVVAGMQPWTEAVQTAALEARLQSRRRKQELRRCAAEYAGRQPMATTTTQKFVEIDPSSPLHPHSWERVEAYVALSVDRRHADFSRHPLPVDGNIAEGYVHVVSRRGLAGLMVACRLPVPAWVQWLEGDALSLSLEQLKDCTRDTYDDVGDFVLRRWLRLQGITTTAAFELHQPGPGDDWRQEAIAVAAASRLRSMHVLPEEGTSFVATAPERLRPAVLLGATGGLAAAYGVVGDDGKKVLGRNIYGAALNQALDRERQRRIIV